ncbi:hypothetical protein [Cellulomonas sp. 73-145]|uniref:hypothetical protein n=1 Tax=Cellulomonas sp. 73-145 TaxID=1895739 RepID=UPI0025C65E4D|nr:hypothetical protein [Cellulomonas sp. 73-145]
MASASLVAAASQLGELTGNPGQQYTLTPVGKFLPRAEASVAEPFTAGFLAA